jgi:hypothetical protein
MTIYMLRRLLPMLAVFATLFIAMPASATIAFDAVSNNAGAACGGAGSSWTHTPSGTPRGVIVIVTAAASNLDLDLTNNFYGSTPLKLVGYVRKATGEAGSVAVLYADKVASGSQTVKVDDLNSNTCRAVAWTVTTANNRPIRAFNRSAWTASSDATANPSVTVDPVGSSLVLIGFTSGQDAVTGITPLANWTGDVEHDYGTVTAGYYRYNTIGTAQVTAGFTQTSEDVAMMAVAVSEQPITFLEPGTSATQDVTLLGTVVGTCTSTTTVVKTSPRSVNCVSSGAGSVSSVGGAWITDQHFRFQMYWQQDLPTGDLIIAMLRPNVGGSNLSVNGVITSSGTFKVCTGTGTSTCSSASGSSVTANTVHRYGLLATISSSTSFTIKVQLDGTTILTVTNANITLADCSGGVVCDNEIGWITDSVGNSKNINISDVYLDTDSSLTDPGDIRVTAKLPASNGTNEFNAGISAAPANRWEEVDDRPVSVTSGWVNNDTDSGAENFGIQAASAGDVNLTGATIYGYSAWLAYAVTNSGLTGGQGATAGFSGTCTSVASATGCTTGSFTVFPGQTVICGLGSNTAAAGEGISDSASNTWTQLSGPTTNTVKLNAWYANIASGKGGSITVSPSWTSSSQKRAFGCMVFDATVTSSPVDTDPTNTTNARSGTSYTHPATGTLTQSNEIVVAINAMAGPTADTTGCGTTVDERGTSGKVSTTGAGASSNVIVQFCAETVSATTTVTPTTTNATSARSSVQKTVSLKLRGSPLITSVEPKITNNGFDRIITTGTAYSTSTVQDAVSHDTYPSNAAGVGAVANTDNRSFALYETGMLVAFTPAASSPTCTSRRGSTSLGTRCGVRQSWSEFTRRPDYVRVSHEEETAR